MKNKKGFAFMETVIILMVVTLSLALLLSTYSLISRKSKEKENYDKASDKYLLYSVMNLGTNARYNYKSMLDENYILGPKITPDNCSEYDVLRNIYNDSELSSSSETNCKKIYESMDIIALYLVKDINQALSSPEATSHFDNGTINYLKTLKKCNDEDNKYIKDGMVINTSEYVCNNPINYLVGVFYRNDEYYFASLVLGDEKLSSNKGTYTVKINYLYAEDKSVAADSYQIELKDIERYDVISPSIKGYTPDKARVSGFINGGNMTINVMYEANNYTLTLDQQSGSGGTSSVTATYNKTLPDIAIPNRTGYTFNGYYSEVNGKGTQYYNADGKSSIEKYTMASDMTLHAYWELDSTKYNCTYDGDLIQGAEYVNGQYTYRYMQKGAYPSDYTNKWSNISTDGWGVQLTDKESTQPVTSELCATINGKPIVNMSYMFNKSKATSIDLSSFNTGNVTNMSCMFYNSAATTLDLSSFDTSKVTNMNSMFDNSKATTLDLSSFDTSNVKYMGWMFNRSQATSLDLSSFDTSKVTDMDLMFATSQATIIKGLENFNTSKVADMRYMFSNTSVKTLDLRSFNTSKVANMSGMFNGSQAAIIKGLENFNTSNVTNMSYMFEISHATTLDLSSFNTSKVTNMESMFYGSKSTEIKGLENFNTSKVTNMRYMFDGTQASELDLRSFDTSNVTDMKAMFSESRATTLDLSSFDTSNVTDMSNMFYQSRATTLDLSSFDTSNVTNMEWMFNGSQATSLNLSSFDTSKVTNMESMFLDSKSTEIKGLENFNTSNVTNMMAMFYNTSVKTLDLRSFNTSKVTNMDYMFEYSKATTGYARTQADADKFNSSSYKPAGLKFVVK